MSKQVIIFIAPPGAGKGTQAELIAKKFGLEHIETSNLGEVKINDPELVKKDPEVAEAKRRYNMGELFPPPWIVKLIVEKIRELASVGRGIVFSGSPRTLYEAENEMPELEKLYGKENIKIFYIKLSENESIRRNSSRRICEKSRHPIPGFPQYRDLVICPEDGSPIITRTLDKPEIIRERYRVFLKDTKPVLDFLKKNDYDAITIEGEQPIGKVQEDIMKHL
ncbi:MAG: nucleoside monophosphate kinase [Candidatus Yanofskybacteria bacterium]|nr:nucleoside monophosphate kinase [Candidatus Yanofskybacteria bacterium]